MVARHQTVLGSPEREASPFSRKEIDTADGAAAGGGRGSARQGAAALDLIGETRTQQVNGGVCGSAKTTSKVSEFREFTVEEKRVWKARKQAENHRRAVISRRWIRDAGLYEKSLLGCGAKQIPEKEAAFSHTESGEFSEGIVRCHSKWSCPECSPYELWKASGKIKRLLLTLSRSGKRRYTCVLLTLTAPHRPGDDLRQQMKDFSVAYGHMLRSRAVRSMERDLGYVGNIRCYDHTVKERGGLADWHTHLHNLFVFEGDYSEDSPEFAKICSVLTGQWATSFEKCFEVKRRSGVSMKALDCERVDLSDSGALADYVSKVVSTYITKTAKREKGIYAPFDLLDDTRDEGYEFRRDCWLDYVQSVKGFKRVNWSAGLQGAIERIEGVCLDDCRDDEEEVVEWSYKPSDDALGALQGDPSTKSLAMRFVDTGDVESFKRLALERFGLVPGVDRIERGDGDVSVYVLAVPDGTPPRPGGDVPVIRCWSDEVPDGWKRASHRWMAACDASD